MKINRLFSIAAAALMMVACSSEETALKNNPAVGSQMPFTATIAVLGSGAGTRTAYTESGTDINVTWSVGDEIALIHNGVKDVATVKTINADGSATITGFITKAENGDGVELVYPSALVTSVTNDGPVFDNDLLGRISTQDGTLKYIQDNLDFRSAKGQLSVNETSATLKEAATMNSMHAIWKLTLQNDAETPAALSAKQVSVQLTADVPILRARTAELTTPISSFYLAMEPFTEAPITILATVGEDTYSYVKEGVTLEAGKYYQSTVTMAPAATDLSKLTGDYTAKNGETLTGTLAGNYKISIADGATVTLDGVTINGVNNDSYKWAGITCEGDATIILKDGTTNTVNGFYQNYPGIYVPSGKTLTIKGETAGTGSLTAICQDKNGFAAGIGGNNEESCGNIVIAGGTINATGGCGAGIGSGPESSCGAITISGGTVTATGGNRGAGIGSGDYGTCGAITISGGTVSATGGAYGAGIGSSLGEGNQSSKGKCGDITISGGTVTATGGIGGAGIGSGYEGSCGNITITTGVTQVTATKGAGANNSIGAGNDGTCGTVTIGGTVYWDGSAYQNGGDTYLTQSTIVYPSPFANVTASDLGKVIGADGKIYADATAATTAGTTAVAMIAYVGSGSDCTHGLAIALEKASSKTLSWDNSGTNNDSKTAAEWCSAWNTSKPVTGGTWRLPSKADWQNMFVACAVSGDASAGDTMNPITGYMNKIKAAAPTPKWIGLSNVFWTSTEDSSDKAWYVSVNLSQGEAVFHDSNKNSATKYVLCCLAF